MNKKTRIALSAFTEKDFDQLISWVEDEMTLMQFAGPRFYFPLSHDQLSLFIQDKKRKVFRIEYIETSEMIGIGEIYWNEQTAKFSRIFIGKEKWRNQGLGQEIIKEMFQMVFENSKMESAELNVYDWNKSAIQCYLNAGFEIDPTIMKTDLFKDKKWLLLNMKIKKKCWHNIYNINRK